ncbi:MAG: hypothetical protein PHR82_06125 [Endomicrobiaceae bacterium]|nr:hypothetical protein [Endomicrobiaceae bacterium]
MKKIFLLVLALALFIPQIASAKINLYGQFDIMGADWQWKTMGSTFENGISFTNTRFLLGGNFDLTENVEGNVALLYVSTWGDNYLAGQQADNSTNTGLLNKTMIAEANVVFKNFFDNDRLTLKVGKFYYGEKGDSIFYVGLRDMSRWLAYSQNYWLGAYNGGMDGVVLNYNDKEKLNIDFLYSKISNENADTMMMAQTKVNISLINAKYKLNDNINLTAYLYDSETAEIVPIGLYGTNRTEIIGFKPEFKKCNLSASAEIAKLFYSLQSNMFDQSETDSLLVKLNAEYRIVLKDMMITPRVQYLRAGQYFATSLSDANFGMMTNNYEFMWGMYNVESLNAGIDFSKGKVKLILDLFKNSNAAGGAGRYEYNAKAEYNYTEDLKLYVGYAYALDAETPENWWCAYSVMGATWKFGK